MTIVDTAQVSTCPGNRPMISWNQTGPAGPKGDMGPQGPVGPAGPPGMGPNPLQVALLRWYTANQTTSFPVGNAPQGVAFDGANIWVTNINGNTVSELRASDGTSLGTFNVGGNPIGVAFDGANVWVANRYSHSVSKL